MTTPRAGSLPKPRRSRDPHGNADREVRRFDDMPGEATLFASDQECNGTLRPPFAKTGRGIEHPAQGFVVQQATGRRTDDCYSRGLCPIGEFAGRTPHQLLRKQRSHAGANGGGVSSWCDPGSSFGPSRKMPVAPAASAVRMMVPRFPGDSMDSTASQSPQWLKPCQS